MCGEFCGSDWSIWSISISHDLGPQNVAEEMKSPLFQGNLLGGGSEVTGCEEKLGSIEDPHYAIKEVMIIYTHWNLTAKAPAYRPGPQKFHLPTKLIFRRFELLVSRRAFVHVCGWQIFLVGKQNQVDCKLIDFNSSEMALLCLTLDLFCWRSLLWS